MGTIITLANHKGGVGKTSMVMNLGGALSQLDYSVLLIDLDSQCNLSLVFLNHQVGDDYTSVMDLILNEIPYDQVIHKTAFKQISIIPATVDLREMDSRLAGEDDAQYFLQEELEIIRENYDYILIDTPPNLNKATRMALVASDYVIVPIECQEWAIKGCQQIFSFVNRVKRRANPELELLGIVVNRFNSRRQIENEYLHALQDAFSDQLFETIFPNHVPFVECVTHKTPLTIYLPHSVQAQTFHQFTREVLNRVETRFIKTRPVQSAG